MPTHTTYKALTPDEIAQALQSELTRLLQSGLTQEEEAIARRYYSDKERKSMDADAFCGPHRSFPITTAADVSNAAHLIGKADDPAAVKACIIRKAKAHGWPLPDAWKEDDGDDGKEEKERGRAGTVSRAAQHEPFTGKHSHGHDHMDGYSHEHLHEHNNDALHDHTHEHHTRSQASSTTTHPPFTGSHIHAHSDGQGDTHEHEHSHDNDANHGHPHTDLGQQQGASRSAATVIQQSNRSMMYAPIVRADSQKWEVLGQATAEVPDSYGTIFGYCPEAWQLWRRNVREQHDPKKAVGKGIDYFLHPETRSVELLSRVSRGAPDTWKKIEDDVLTGYSLSVIPDPEYGNDPQRWPKKEYNGKLYPYLPRYTIAEVSLVDNPACPDCNIAIVRADGFATEVLDTTITETEEEPPATKPPLERAGRQISAATRGKLHDSIGHTLQAARSQMQNCADAGCEDCQAALKQMDPDGDGDIDAFGGLFGDIDGDAGSLFDDASQARSLESQIERILEKHLQPVFARLQSIAGTLARSMAAGNATSSPALETLIDGALTRVLKTLDLPTAASLSEVRADLSAVKETVARIDNTPMPGAPVLNASALPRPAARPVDKQLATDPYQPPQRSGSAVYDAIARMSEAGLLDTPDRQTDAIAAGLIAQRGGR
jgi:hypothetical protein